MLTFSSYRRCIGDGAVQSPRDECSWLSIAVIHETLVGMRGDPRTIDYARNRLEGRTEVAPTRVQTCLQEVQGPR